MGKKIITHNNGIVETRETFYIEKTIQQLKQQLSEKDEQINNLEQICQICNKDQENEKLKQQLEEKDKEIADLKEWQEWHSMWHEKFQKQIEDLTTELETYRPTKLHGNGQCECFKCKQEGRQAREWTDWCNKYKGHIYCDDCLKEILKEEQTSQTQLAIQELEKVKVNLKDRISMMKNEEHSYLQKVVTWYDICDQINQQIKELKGE